MAFPITTMRTEKSSTNMLITEMSFLTKETFVSKISQRQLQH